MTFTPYRAKTTRKATTIKAELKHNLGSLLGKVVCTPTYEGASADWIENITLEDKGCGFCSLRSKKTRPILSLKKPASSA